MEVNEQEKLYKAAVSKISVLEVITQPEDIAKHCKKIASLFREAGNYKDAQELAAQYEKKAKEILEEGKKITYNRAIKILDNAKNVSDYDRGLELIRTVEGYGDAKAKQEEYHNKKLDYIKKNNIKFGVRGIILAACVVAVGFFGNRWLNKKAEEGKDTAAGLETVNFSEPGDEIAFGKYTWKVLDRTTDRIKLIATHIDQYEELNEVSFHDSYADVTWEQSDVRAWLNGEFLENGFSHEERSMILESEISNLGNSKYQTPGGEDTKDRVYLLDENETLKYWNYIKSMDFNCMLRSPGNTADTVSFVSADHKIMTYGIPADAKLSIRPVIEIAVSEQENTELNFAEAKAGDKIVFGGMNWKVLDLNDKEAVLISLNSDIYAVLNDKQYHEKQEDVTWENSSVRAWLNGEFLETQFSEEERARIILTKNENKDNSAYGTAGGNTTQDYIYLLSEAEAEAYWSQLNSMSLNWMLRTPGNGGNSVTYVTSDHEINTYGCAVTDLMYLRPVLRISR